VSREPLVVRWYRLLLAIYPPGLRGEHGEEMVEVIRRRWDRVRGDAAPRRVAFCLRAWGQALLQAGAAWLERGARVVTGPGGGARRGGGPGPPQRGPGDLVRGLKLALRSLLRTPAFTGAAVLTLALGIGANTAIFSIVRTVLLEPLPFPDPDRLVTVTEAERAWTWTPTEIVLELRSSAPELGEIAGLYPRRLTVTGDGTAVEVEGAEATPNLFGVLGVEVARGRGFTPEDGRPGAPPTAILTPGFRDRRYGVGADVVGRTLRVDGTSHRIVGVLAADVPRLTPRSGASRSCGPRASSVRPRPTAASAGPSPSSAWRRDRSSPGRAPPWAWWWIASGSGTPTWRDGPRRSGA